MCVDLVGAISGAPPTPGVAGKDPHQEQEEAPHLLEHTTQRCGGAVRHVRYEGTTVGLKATVCLRMDNCTAASLMVLLYNWQ